MYKGVADAFIGRFQMKLKNFCMGSKGEVVSYVNRLIDVVYRFLRLQLLRSSHGYPRTTR